MITKIELAFYRVLAGLIALLWVAMYLWDGAIAYWMNGWIYGLIAALVWAISLTAIACNLARYLIWAWREGRGVEDEEHQW
jgi:hypothetical protein